MLTIKLKNGLAPAQEQWLAHNVGPRMHYLHTSIGGQGWIAKSEYVAHPSGEQTLYKKEWTLTFEDDKFASWFTIMFS
jgi:hypothetical protein